HGLECGRGGLPRVQAVLLGERGVLVGGVSHQQGGLRVVPPRALACLVQTVQESAQRLRVLESRPLFAGAFRCHHTTSCTAGAPELPPVLAVIAYSGSR